MKIMAFLTVFLSSVFPAFCLAEDFFIQEKSEIEVLLPEQQEQQEECSERAELASKIISIRNQYLPARDNIYYFEINIAEAMMTVFQVVPGGDSPCLKMVSEHFVGTPKVRDYPQGFGIITSVEFNPCWMPTKATVEEFSRQGIDLWKFMNKDGRIVVPPGNPLNYMGPIKMSIRFVTPQKTERARRNVYRIHGIIPNQHYKKMLGTRCSSGCIRVDNEELADLANKTQGAAVVINYM